MLSLFCHSPKIFAVSGLWSFCIESDFQMKESYLYKWGRKLKNKGNAIITV